VGFYIILLAGPHRLLSVLSVSSCKNGSLIDPSYQPNPNLDFTGANRGNRDQAEKFTGVCPGLWQRYGLRR
jgi:hypothetical protein